MTTEGKCRLCGNQYSGRGMSRHLQTCLKRAAPLGHPGSAGAEVFHIAVESAFISDYWLHLQAPASARFADLDDLLRKVWLECCGHLSGFGVRRGIDASIDMDDRLGNVLEKGFRFSYTYDFGSSTELMLRVIDRYLAPGEHRSILILARNDPPQYLCECGKPATEYCETTAIEYGESPFMCPSCADHDCAHDHVPIDNSPRVGVCGYVEGHEPEGAQISALGNGAATVGVDTGDEVAAAVESAATGLRELSSTDRSKRRDKTARPKTLQDALNRLAGTVRSLPKKQRGNWIGARRPNSLLSVGTPPIRPDIAVWVDADRGRILGMRALDVESDIAAFDDAPDETLAHEIAALESALANPSGGRPSRPASITVTSTRLAALLEEALTPLGIDVLTADGQTATEILSELDAIVAEFLNEMLDTPPSLATLKTLGKKDLEQGFDAAADFFRCAPWRFLEDDDPIAVTVGSTTYHAVIMGASGITYGLAVYDDAEALADFLDLAGPSPKRAIAVVFDNKAELDPRETKLIDKLGLKVAANRAFPQFVSQISDGGFAPLTPDAFKTLIACLKALSLFISKHRTRLEKSVWDEKDIIRETVHVRLGTLLTAEVEYPDLLE